MAFETVASRQLLKWLFLPCGSWIPRPMQTWFRNSFAYFRGFVMETWQVWCQQQCHSQAVSCQTQRWPHWSRSLASGRLTKGCSAWSSRPLQSPVQPSASAPQGLLSFSAALHLWSRQARDQTYTVHNNITIIHGILLDKVSYPVLRFHYKSSSFVNNSISLYTTMCWICLHVCCNFISLYANNLFLMFKHDPFVDWVCFFFEMLICLACCIYICNLDKCWIVEIQAHLLNQFLLVVCKLNLVKHRRWMTLWSTIGRISAALDPCCHKANCDKRLRWMTPGLQRMRQLMLWQWRRCLLQRRRWRYWTTGSIRVWRSWWLRTTSSFWSRLRMWHLWGEQGFAQSDLEKSRKVAPVHWSWHSPKVTRPGVSWQPPIPMRMPVAVLGHCSFTALVVV